LNQYIEKGDRKMKIIYDENGNRVDELAERNEEIKAKLAPILNEFVDEKERMIALKKPAKLGYQFTKQIYLVLAGYGLMSAEKFVDLDYDDIYDLWLKYLDLTAYYNRYFEIVDNKQLFCAFAGLNTRQYAELERSDNDDIKNLMITINNAFVGLGFVAGESGNADVKAVSTRLRANGEAGHGVISASEDELLKKVEVPSENDLMRQLKSVLGGEPKQLK
jgi:hypothetical protein